MLQVTVSKKVTFTLQGLQLNLYYGTKHLG